MGKTVQYEQVHPITVLAILRDTLRARFNADAATAEPDPAADVFLGDDRMSELMATIEGLIEPPAKRRRQSSSVRKNVVRRILMPQKPVCLDPIR